VTPQGDGGGPESPEVRPGSFALNTYPALPAVGVPGCQTTRGGLVTARGSV